jgi:hypothetical protein
MRLINKKNKSPLDKQKKMCYNTDTSKREPPQSGDLEGA